MKAKELTLCGLFIALITVGTFIRIPIPGGDYFTLQFLFTLLAGIVLGGRLGALAVGTYVLLGLVGVPVFAAGGGPGYIVQPTFGYLLGFILQAWFCGHYAHQLKDVTFRRLLLVNVGGMAIVYGIGLVWFYIFSNYVADAPISVWGVILYCGILQCLPDFLLVLGATVLGLRLQHRNLWLMQEEKGTLSYE